MSSKLVHWTRHFPRFSVFAIVTVFFMAVAIFAGCTPDGDDLLDDLFRSPNVEPIRASIKTAVPLAHAAAVSMAAMQGAIGDDVQVERTSGSFPCAAVIEFPIDPDDMPYAFDEGSRAVVAGFWSSSDQAILTVAFHDTTAGVSSFKVSKVATFPVKAVDFPQPGYVVVYANADINIDIDPNPADLSDDEKDAEFHRLELTTDEDPDVNIALDAWIIEVDNGDSGSLIDFTDDGYSISGGGQYVDVTSSGGNTATGVYQLGLVGIRVDESCSDNPLGGLALIQELGVDTGDDIPLAATALLDFDGNCNGRIHVSLATGNYIASIGSTLDFYLNQP